MTHKSFENLRINFVFILRFFAAMPSTNKLFTTVQLF
jgi:hypothetical protein